MHVDSVNIQNIIDLKELRLLFEDFSTATDFTAGLVDPKTGEFIVHTGWRDICTEFHHTYPETKNQCLVHNKPDLAGVNQANQILIRHCPNGLIYGFTPIIIEGHHLATLFTGQVLLAPADKEHFRLQAQKYGFDEQKYLRALAQVPVSSEEKFHAMLRYLAKNVTLFAQTGLSNLQSHQEAEKKESLLQSIFRSTPTGINHLAVERRLYWANEKFAEITGYSLQELQDKKASLLYADDENFEEAGHQIYGSLEKYGTGSMDTKWRRKDGSVIDVHLSASKVALQDFPESVIFSVLDITARKKIEEDLRKSEEQWQRTFNSFSDIVTILDPEYRIDKINKAGCEAVGLTEQEILGRHCHEIYADSHVPCPDCPIDKTIKKRTPHTNEIYQEKFDKTFQVSSSPVLNDEGELIQIVHVAKDITSFKKLEADRVLLATAIDQAAETVLIHDTNGVIQYANPAFEKASGYTIAEALGQKICFLKSDNQDSQFYEKMWSTLTQGKVWRCHMTNRKKDGSLFEENVTVSPVKNHQGEITNFVAVKSDVSKEVQLQSQLRQAMKMEAIGILAGGIAHDFNNILTSIIGYGQFAQTHLTADDPVRIYLSQVISAGNRAAELIKQILAFSRQTDEDYRLVNIDLLVNEILKLLRASLPSTITIKKNIAPNCGICLADPTQIHQVIMNLCTNAKHAIGNEIGSLSVGLSEIEITSPESMADRPLLEPGTYLDLAISDTGCGMDQVTLSKIFDPFFTTKEKGQGTGLGLSVARGIIKQCQGEITVTSEPGQGTTFHVYLPVQEGKAHYEQPVIEEALPGKSERLLLVDDEELIITIHKLLLDDLGYQVTTTSSSLNALKIFKENPNAFDLVLTDMTMPEKNGTDLAKEMLEIRPDIPIILCTGHSESTNEERAKAIGIRKFLLKPVAFNTLAKALREMLDSER
ncbi:MAG: PAS domain S-box protein [Thermodesulfobacteriota bacterium]